MKSYIPDLELPENQFKPPSRDDMLAAGSALVRRSLASSTPPTASQPVHRAATIGTRSGVPVGVAATVGRAATIGTRSGVGAVGGCGGVKGSSWDNVGCKQGRQVDVTPSGEIQVRLYDEWGSEGDRQFRGYGDRDSGVRAVEGYWDWGAEGCSSDDEWDDSVKLRRLPQWNADWPL